jgi:hypothetical protein
VKGLQERLERASLGTVFAWTSLLFFVVRTVTDAFTARELLEPLQLVIRLLSAAIFGGIMTFVVSRQRRRSGGASTFADISHAIKAGRVPLDADPAVWIPALEWRRGQFRRSLFLTPVFLGVIAVLGVVAFVLDPSSPVGLIAALVLVGLLVGVTIQARRTLPRIDDLLRQLRERDGARGPVDAEAPARPAGA